MKCKIESCKKPVSKNDLRDEKAVLLVINDKNCYFCCKEHATYYIEGMKQKNEDKEWLDKITVLLKDYLGYDEGQVLPKSLYTRLQDLRNGTNRSTRKIKNQQKSGYPYPMVYTTMVLHKDKIMYAISNKNFDNEGKKLNYIMAIVEGNINTIFENWKRNQIISARNDKAMKEFEIDTEIINRETEVNKPQTKDISRFIEDLDI